MVDLESHRIIDLISSRETTDVANWLAIFPNIQVISRDGAATYSSAATGSHPEAIQVSDRFHLITGIFFKQAANTAFTYCDMAAF